MSQTPNNNLSATEPPEPTPPGTAPLAPPPPYTPADIANGTAATLKLQRLDKFKITIAVIGTLLGVSVILVMIAILANRAVTPPQIAGVKSDAEREELLRTARAQDHETLTTYGWVNREKGTVRIPIDQAIQSYIAKPTTQGK